MGHNAGSVASIVKQKVSQGRVALNRKLGHLARVKNFDLPPGKCKPGHISPARACRVFVAYTRGYGLSLRAAFFLLCGRLADHSRVMVFCRLTQAMAMA